MDICKIRFTRLQSSILRLLCIKAGSKMHQRSIAKTLNVSPTAVSKALQNLAYIKIEKALTKEVELNRDDPEAVHYKRTENLRMIYESGLAEYLTERNPGAAIILFGSYSYGEDTTKSDIDIAILGKKKKIDTTSFEKTLQRPINIQFYEDFRNINKNLKTSVINGVILNGIVEI